MTSDNFIMTPLDFMLGSEGKVSLLRVMSLDGSRPISTSRLAKRAGLTPAGARKALGQLVQTGLVRTIGSGRSVAYEIREDEPLSNAVKMIFEKEQSRSNAFFDSLRRTLKAIPEILSAWIEEIPEGPGQELNVVVIVPARNVPEIGQELRTRLYSVEKQYDCLIEIEVLTKADNPERAPDATPLVGTMEARVRKSPRTQSAREERDLKLSKEIAKVLKQNPSLIQSTIRHLDRQLEEGVGTAANDLSEWRMILCTYSIERLQQFMASNSTRAKRLRQSNPFWAVLSPTERDSIFESLDP